MKRKYYPHFTAAAAMFLTVAPLLLTCTIIYGSTFAFDDEPNVASDTFPRGDLDRTQAATSKPATPKPTLQNSVAATKNSAVSSLDKTVVREVAEKEKPTITQAPLARHELPPAAMPAEVPSESVPAPMDIAQDLPMLDTGMMAAAASEPAVGLSEPVVAASDSAAVEIPKRPDVDASYYQATGHLALVPQPQVPDPMSKAQTSEPSTNNADKSTAPESADAKGKTTTKSKKEPKAKDRDGKGKSDSEKSIAEMANELTAASRTAAPAASEKKPADGVAVEDVAIQTPLESATVSRVEDVVAMTGAKGWPVALVKSDLPDDVWWVQQMVGIQGNSFAARVNFGNEHSVSGTAYRMVIVFLDSPDEVRRFRIAKQFKEIPAGARRSREFVYVRR